MRSLGMSALVLWVSCNAAFADDQYDFRTSAAYQALKSDDRDNLEQVHKDFVLLWGALDMYADAHDGQVPPKLSDLVPHYLRRLPKDPFATAETAAEHEMGHFVPSSDGFGYRYRRGQGAAFVLCSVGLKGFPYLAKNGNVDLYIAKGFWTGGGQLVR